MLRPNVGESGLPEKSVLVKVTPAISEAMYNCLKSMKPFNKWNLPESDHVEFYINGLKGEMGAHLHKSDTHQIRLSQHNVDDFQSLATTVAHEMIHVRQFMDGKQRGHGNSFMQYASQICEEMVWHMRDLK